MRSQTGSSEGQERLPFDLVPAPSAPAAPGRATRPERDGTVRYRLPSDALASRGWPAGTELLIDPDRRPRRGQVALVREGGRLKVGVFDVELGRATLHSDRGSVWIGASAQIVGVATLAGAPLAGMPSPPAL